MRKEKKRSIVLPFNVFDRLCTIDHRFPRFVRIDQITKFIDTGFFIFGLLKKKNHRWTTDHSLNMIFITFLKNKIKIDQRVFLVLKSNGLRSFCNDVILEYRVQ